MPEIPELAQPVGLDYSAPNQIANVDSAGMIGEGLQRTGNAVANFGELVGRVQNEKKASRISLDGQSAHQKALTAGLEIYDNALKNSKPDGSDMVDNFHTSFDKATQEIQKSFDNDSATQESVQTHIANVRNDLTFKVQNQARTQGTEYIQNMVMDATRMGQSIVYQDPSQYDSQAVLLTKTFADISGGKSNFYDRKTAIIMQRTAAQDLAHAAIRRYVDLKQYDTATKLLETKFSAIFDRAQLEAADEMIHRRQLQDTHESLAAEQHLEIMNKRLLDKDQTRNAANFSVALAESKNNPELHANILSDMADAAGRSGTGNGSISHADYNFQVALDKRRSEGGDDFVVYYNYVKRITGEEDLDKIRKSAVSDPLLTKHGPEVLKMIETRQKTSDGDPTVSKEWVSVTKTLNAKVGEDNPLGLRFMKQEEKDTWSALYKRTVQLVRDKHMRPMAALDRAFLERAKEGNGPAQVGTGTGTAPVKYQDPSTLKELDEILKNVDADFKYKRIDNNTYNQWLDYYPKKKKFIEDKMKAGGK